MPKDFEWTTGAKVYLKQFVRVGKNWRKDSKAFDRFGY
jgi:GTPase Era involved in 16S rRNA processing